MSYNQDVFIDNCVARLVQIAVAIRQNNDALARQDFDSDELACQDFDEEESDCQYFDTTDNA